MSEESTRSEEETSAEPHEEEEEETPLEQVMLEGLVILPPRQLHPSDKRQVDAVALPPLRAEEVVQSLRAALSEVVGYAHLTNFRFEVQEKPVFDEKAAPNGRKNLVSLRRDTSVSKSEVDFLPGDTPAQAAIRRPHSSSNSTVT